MIVKCYNICNARALSQPQNRIEYNRKEAKRLEINTRPDKSDVPFSEKCNYAVLSTRFHLNTTLGSDKSIGSHSYKGQIRPCLECALVNIVIV